MTNATLTVGQFTLNANGTVSGPGQYLEDQGNKLLDAIFAGNDTVFNMTWNYSPNIETAMLVRLQTDYAGWLGQQEMLGWLKP